MIAESIDSPDFIARLAGLNRDREQLEQSAETIVAGVARRVEAIRRNWYLRQAELGEELLQIQEQRPGDFESWLSIHRRELAFGRATAYRCRATAQQVRDHGLEVALDLALGEKHRERPEPFLSLRFSLSVAPEQVPTAEIPALLERLRPAVELSRQLEERASAA